MSLMQEKNAGSSRPRKMHWKALRLHVNRRLRIQEKQLYYFATCRLPCLQLRVHVLEQGREELNAFDSGLLMLIDSGVRTISGLSDVTAMAPRSVVRIMSEKIGEFLAEEGEQGLVLTNLGKKSIELGVPVKRTERVLRLCGLTSRLLPADAYQYEWKPLTGVMSGRLPFGQFLPEREVVSTEAIDICKIEDPRAFNLPEETIEIESIVDYLPGYQEGKLCIYGSGRHESAEVLWGRSMLNYAISDITPLIDFINPAADFSNSRNKSKKEGMTHAEFARKTLEKDGVVVSKDLHRDKNGILKIEVSSVSKKWLSSSPDENRKPGVERDGSDSPWVLLCGTANMPAVPATGATCFRRMNDNPVEVYVNDPAWSQEIETLRHLDEAVFRYYNDPVSDRKQRDVRSYLLDCFDNQSLEYMRKLTKKFKVDRLRKALPIE